MVESISIVATSTPIENENTAIAGAVTGMTADINKFTPDWQNRRKVVMISLMLLGGLFSCIILTLLSIMLAEVIWGKVGTVDANVISAASTALWVISFSASSIIGGYVFGASWDFNNYRSSVIELVDKMKR